MGIKEFLGEYGTSAKFPEIAGRYAGRNLVICGDAACIWNDLELLGCRCDDGRGSVRKDGHDFLMVNKIGEVFPGKIEHWYSNAANVVQRSVAARRDEYRKEFGGPAHTHSLNAGVDHVWPFGGHGSSALGGALVGVALGYDKIVLCGIPLDDGPHNGEPHWRKTAFASSEVAGGQRTDRNPHWEKAIALAFDGKVTSMSGRTRKWIEDANRRAEA